MTLWQVVPVTGPVSPCHDQPQSGVSPIPQSALGSRPAGAARLPSRAQTGARAITRSRPCCHARRTNSSPGSGQGTPMGNTLRRYWIPALLSREIAEPDGPPTRVRLLGEDLVAFRDSEGRIGLLDELCPHRRASLYLRAQRGMRPALRLSRLEVRRLRRLHRHDERAGRERLQAQGPPHRVSHRRAGRHHLGLSRPGGAHAAAAEIRLDAGAGNASPRHQGDPGVQLAAGAGRRHRHLARADHAPA